MNRKQLATPEMRNLLSRTVAQDLNAAYDARVQIAKALTLPLRQGVMRGDIIGGIFSPVYFQPGQQTEFPLDLLAPGSENNYVAYTIPNIGAVPQRQVEGDYVTIQTYDVASSIDWPIKYSRDARWDIVGRALQVLEGTFTRKANNDGWHVILAAGAGRNLLVYDDAATAGLFTKRLIALGKTVMRRKAGGNSTSVNRGRLTDFYTSPENLEDMRSWDLTQVDDFTRREIFVAGDGEASLTRIFGVVLHDLDELGVGQEYTNYFTNATAAGGLGGAFTNSKVELSVGLDLSKDDSFVMPIREEVQIYEDPTFHRQRRAGLYAFGEHGFGCLDSRRVLLLQN